jgi:hypothetical protein
VKVLGNSYPHIKNDICTRRLAFKPVTLEFIRAQFVEQFNNLKLHDSKRKGGKKEIKLGADGSETTEEEDEKGMVGDAMSNHQAPPRIEMGAMGVAPQAQRWQPYPKQFKGRCHYCGEQGHKTAECPNKGGASTAIPGAIPSGGQWMPRPPAMSTGGQWTPRQPTTSMGGQLAPRQPCQNCQRPTHSSD